MAARSLGAWKGQEGFSRNWKEKERGRTEVSRTDEEGETRNSQIITVISFFVSF